jgi:dephospho-CoA kinase
MLRVGLTGGIATGKSRVLRRMAEAGFHTLDLDRVAHEVTAPGGSAYAEVVEAFGHGILGPDGRIDRGALGAVVFAEESARERLNAIVHPKVRAEEARRAAALAGEPGAVMVTDAALLVEAGVHLRFDRLVVVWCPQAIQVRRLMQRDGLDERSARARVAAQMPGEEKRRYGHYVLDSSGAESDTDEAAAAVAEELGSIAAARRGAVAVSLDRAAGCLIHGPEEGPRGLDPMRIVHSLTEAGGIELQALARRLRPPHDGAWYRAANARQGGPGPEALAGPLALWALARHGEDADYLCAAAASLARLTHLDATAIAAAVVASQALQEAVSTGALPPPGTRVREAWQAGALRWAGTPAPGWVEASIEAARSHPMDAAAAVSAAAAAGAAEPRVAGALVGACGGTSGAPLPPGLAGDISGLLRAGVTGRSV